MVDTIEDIILSNDRRAIGGLRSSLSEHYCEDAAKAVLGCPDGPIFITTGFFIRSGNAVETDGPPGAAAIGRALESLGRTVLYVTDIEGVNVLRSAVGPGAEIIEFPHGDITFSRSYSGQLLEIYSPSLLISIERCGPSSDGIYRNMRGDDISEHTARVDSLFDLYGFSVGIGDGGNEVGMGNFASEIASLDGLPDFPAITRTRDLVIASVSNWGAYGLVAAMSLLVRRNMLPSIADDTACIRRCVAAGAVDGFSGRNVLEVDGLVLGDYNAALANLDALLRSSF